MCNVLVANTIVELLEQKVLNGEVFTAFDVTSAARATTDDNVRHNDVRNIVNNEFITSQMAGYERELCTLDLSGSPQAFVYFPDTKSASDHPLVSADSVDLTDDSDDDTDSHDSFARIPTTSDTSTDNDVVLGDDEVKTTKEGRVQIPRNLTSQVTPNGGTIDVLVNGTLKCASKDARGDVRICLKQFGISDSKVKVTVDTTNNTINVETA
jgi:hypothetical protein